MRKLREKLDFQLFKAKVSLQDAADKFINEERGDTNFISIAIILIVIIAIAIVFINFKDTILKKLNSSISSLTKKL